MTDDTNDRGARDRARVAGEQDYEVRYFADKHGITIQQAKDLIEKHGNSREELDAAAGRIKG